MQVKRSAELKETKVEGIPFKAVTGKKIAVEWMKVPPNVSFDPHGHPGEGIGYMLKGQLEVYTDLSPEKVVVNAGDFMVLQPGEKIGGRNPGSEDAEFLCIEERRE